MTTLNLKNIYYIVVYIPKGNVKTFPCLNINQRYFAWKKFLFLFGFVSLLIFSSKNGTKIKTNLTKCFSPTDGLMSASFSKSHWA